MTIKTFIDRPLLSIVINVMVVAVGIIALESPGGTYRTGGQSPCDSSLGIIVSLVGTFAFMAVADFSVNMLTLFALVLVSATSGTFYKQFGLTMAVAVGISLFYAITLAPALCAMILRAHKE